MTPWERKLWYEFLKYYPIRFQRQKAIGDYIVDFYCAAANLAIELDGGGHFTEHQLESDRLRTVELQKYHVRILRFQNNDVKSHFSEVCEKIDTTIHEIMK